MKAFKQASSSANENLFKKADDLFTQSIDKFKLDPNVTNSSTNFCIVDPETFIYQYNSKVAQTVSARNGSLPTIAVVIPSESNLDITLEILRGVAQVLKEQNTNTPLFQILLVKDNNNLIEDVKRIANYISNNNIPEEFDYFQKSQNLGVIGRYTSRYIWEAGGIYGGQKLVLIAPTSTAIREFPPETLQPNLHHYVFRTASNDSIAAKNLAEYMWDALKLRKVLIIYESTDPHSKSLTEEFQNQLTNRNPNEINYQLCDLSASSFNKKNCISTVKTAEAEVNALMLAPGYITLNNILNIAQLGANRNFKILTGDVLYNRQISKNPETFTNKIVLAVFSHADKVQNNFKSQTINLWGIKKVSWRTMTSYDAAQAFVKALSDLRENANPTRQNIYEKLNNTSFSAPGATTEVRFDPDHDRKAATGVGVLVQLNRSNPNSDEYGFTLLETPQRNNP
nr:ABC transporter substrate-binding protein [Nostoc sp. CHAB 5715]